MFKPKNLYLRFKPENGLTIKLRAKISFYEPRGEFQLIVESMELIGAGDLMLQYEALKQTLASEGLFALEKKIPLPVYPNHIAIITSSKGAAIKDMLSIIERRFPLVQITIYDTLVQGKEAPKKIIAALNFAEKNHHDSIVIARGGGSIEDLWAFNDDKLARTIANCKTPILSAVGHEIDFTICDFVADKRAATPSEAAEMLVPNKQQLIQHLLLLAKRMKRLLQMKLHNHIQMLDSFEQRLSVQQPSNKLTHKKQQLQQFNSQLNQALKHKLFHCQNQHQVQQNKLLNASPIQAITLQKTKLQNLDKQFMVNIQQLIKNKQKTLAHLAQSLDNLSPLRTLGRGYSLTKVDQTLVTSIQQLKTGVQLTTYLKDGKIKSNVVQMMPVDYVLEN